MTEPNRPLDTMDEVAYRELHAENRRLKKEIKELREDNKKLAHQIEDRIDRMRKSGM